MIIFFSPGLADAPICSSASDMRTCVLLLLLGQLCGEAFDSGTRSGGDPSHQDAFVAMLDDPDPRVGEYASCHPPLTYFLHARARTQPHSAQAART